MTIADFINENPSVVISGIALISSIFAPVITTRLNNRHDREMRKLELEYQKQQHNEQFYDLHRAEVIERYLNVAGKAIRHHSLDNDEEFGTVMGEIYLYVDESEWPLLGNLETYIRNGNKTAATETISELCKILAKKGVRNRDTLTPKSQKCRPFRRLRKSKKQK